MADALNTYRGWLAKAQELNPGVPEQQLADYWQDNYARASELPAAPGTLSDVGTLLSVGMHGLAVSAREVGRRLFGETIGDMFDRIDEATGYVPKGDAPFEQRLAEKALGLERSLSPAMQEARQKDWWNEEESRFGSAWTDWRAYLAGVVESLPGTVATMTPAGILAQQGGRFVLRKSLEAGLTKEAAEAAAGKAVARTAWAAGGALEGLQQAGSTGFQVRTAIERLPLDTLAESDSFLSLVESGMTPDEARQRLAQDASLQAMVVAGTTTALFGGAGDRMLARAIGGELSGRLWKRMAQGVVAEGILEEAPQGALAKMAENIALREAGEDVGIIEGALNEALGGAVAGGIMGAGMAVPFAGREQQITLQALDDVKAGETVDDVADAAQRWSDAQAQAIAESLRRTLDLEVQAADVFPTAEAGRRAELEAGARGETAAFVPFEAVPPPGVEGEPQQGVFLARNVPLHETEGRPSFVFDTEADAQKLDPSGERLRVELAPDGFAVMPVPGAAAKNIADLNEAQQKEAARLLGLSERKASAGDVQAAAKLAGFASRLRQMTYTAAPDAAVDGAPFVRAVANMFGADVQFFTASQPGAANGWVVSKNGRRTLYINAKATKPHMQVMGHELTHFLEVAHPDLYAQARTKLAPLFRQYAKDEVAKRYAGSGLTEDGLTNELMGDFFGSEIGNRQLWGELKKREPGLFRDLAKRVLEFIDRILTAVKQGRFTTFDRRVVSDVQAARAAVADMLAEVGRRTESQRQTRKAVSAAEAAQLDPGREEGQQFPRDTAPAAPLPHRAEDHVISAETGAGRLPLMSIEVTVPAVDPETGVAGRMKESAQAALLRVDEQLRKAKALLECLRS